MAITFSTYKSSSPAIWVTTVPYTIVNNLIIVNRSDIMNYLNLSIVSKEVITAEYKDTRFGVLTSLNMTSDGKYIGSQWLNNPAYVYINSIIGYKSDDNVRNGRGTAIVITAVINANLFYATKELIDGGDYTTIALKYGFITPITYGTNKKWSTFLDELGEVKGTQPPKMNQQFLANGVNTNAKISTLTYYRAV